MPEITIDNNTYYPSGSITVFPSSNAVDDGKIFTELNGRNITINITDLNYVVSPNPGGFDLSFTDNSVVIAQGKAIVNGFEVETSTTLNYRLPTSDEIVNEGYYANHALLCLHTLFDSLNNLSGNIQVGSEWFCSGIQVVYATYDEYTSKPNEYLLLGGVKEDGTIKPNKDKYTRIDAKYILVKIEGDPETGAPPTQSTDLLTFINNFLKGYWVSKAGDNEYGELLFKSQPTGYLEEGFDYETEDPLSSDKFGVKITRTGGTIVIKPETETAANMVTQYLPGIIGFYKGLYKGDSNTDFDEEIIADNNVLPSANYSKQNLLKIFTDGGALRLTQKQGNAGPILSVENNIAGHNGVEAGKVIYANQTGSDISDSDINTEYAITINYLVDNQGSIKTVDASNRDKYIVLDTIDNMISIVDTDISVSTRPALSLQSGLLLGTVQLSNTNNTKDSNNSSWTNVIDITDNLRVKATTDENNLGSIQAEGFIVAGTQENPAAIQVPDVANSGGNRTLKSGDIYGTQVWSAVYNDYAEMFKIHPEDKDKIKPGMILAVDSKDNDYYVLSDIDNCCVVGVVSENPAYCAGGDGCEYSVPVALAGRVKVKMNTEMRKCVVGDFVTWSDTKPGYGFATMYNDDTVGKIIKIIDENTVEIIVSLG